MSADFKPGDRVRITRGAFASLEGVVLEPSAGDPPPIEGVDPSTALLVGFNLFGSEAPIRMPPEFLELIDPPPAG